MSGESPPDGERLLPADGRLRGERLVLRPAGDADVDALTRILREPAVARWWGRYDPAGVRSELAGSFAIEVGNEVSGWLQVHEELDPDRPCVAFDIAVSEKLAGQGFGREALRVAIAYFSERGHHRFTIDPALDNARAIRAYEAVGFKQVGVLRAYERAPDGSWRDGLLMDLVV